MRKTIKTRKELLTEFHDECLAKVVTCEIEIRLLEQTPEDETIGEKPTSEMVHGIQGRVAIKPAEGIKMKQELKAIYEKRLLVIEEMLKLC